MLFFRDRLAPEDFLVGLVFSGTAGVVFGMTGEGAAGGVVGACLYLAAHVGGRGELQALAGGHGAYLVAASVCVVILTFGNVNHGKGAERLDGDEVAALGELIADLVEHGGQHLLDGGSADSAALDDG